MTAMVELFFGESWSGISEKIAAKERKERKKNREWT
jgi:hypothetical protein